ncbi:putative S-adenosyl-L-methionine-dependent methyltransferase [Seiridium unicorne]|uniref:S-adenosyl-L-methionine-dependent methyltransferase n=1 Tax=Seiridium unicorne TaxID=138068 RepID=A0ABR2ULS9_9PEZI
MADIGLEEGTVDEDENEDEEMELDENVPRSAGDEDAGEWGGITDVAEPEGNNDNTGLSFFDELKQASSEVPKTKSKRKKTKVAALVKEKIRRVLEDVTGLADQRAGKCDENDYLRLLHAFNQEDLHFS